MYTNGHEKQSMSVENIGVISNMKKLMLRSRTWSMVLYMK